DTMRSAGVAYEDCIVKCDVQGAPLLSTDPVLHAAVARVQKIYSQTFWPIPDAFVFGQASQALAKRGYNVDTITAAAKIQARLFARLYVEQNFGDAAAAGIFARDPDAKKFIMFSVGVVAGHRVQFAFEDDRGAEARRDIIVRHARCGGDRGVTGKSLRQACGLFEKTSNVAGSLRAEIDAPNSQEQESRAPKEWLDFSVALIRECHNNNMDFLTLPAFKAMSLPTSCKLPGPKPKAFARLQAEGPWMGIGTLGKAADRIAPRMRTNNTMGALIGESSMGSCTYPEVYDTMFFRSVFFEHGARRTNAVVLAGALGKGIRRRGRQAADVAAREAARSRLFVDDAVGAQSMGRRLQKVSLANTFDLGMGNFLFCILPQMSKRLGLPGERAFEEEMAIFDRLQKNRRRACELELSAGLPVRKGAFLEVVRGASAPVAFKGNEFLAALSRAPRMLRWLAVSLLPEVHSAMQPHEGTWAEVSIFSYLWQGVENNVLQHVVSCICGERAKHLLLHFDCARVGADRVAAAGGVDNFCSECSARVHAATGYDVTLRNKGHSYLCNILRAKSEAVADDGGPRSNEDNEHLFRQGNCMPCAIAALTFQRANAREKTSEPQGELFRKHRDVAELLEPPLSPRASLLDSRHNDHLNFFELLRAKGLAVDDYDSSAPSSANDRLFRKGNCMARAFAAATGQWQSVREKILEQQVEDFRKYHDVAELLGTRFFPRQNLQDCEGGRYLLRSENGGPPRCIGAVFQHGEVVICEKGKAQKMSVSAFEECYVSALDIKTVVAFCLDGSIDDDESAQLDGLLDVLAAGDDEGSEASCDVESFDEGTVDVRSELLRALKAEVDAAKAVMRNLLTHLCNYHNPEKKSQRFGERQTGFGNYVASGTKQMEMIFAMFDSDRCQGKSQGRYPERSAQMLRESVKPALTCLRIDRGIRLLLDGAGPIFINASAVVPEPPEGPTTLARGSLSGWSFWKIPSARQLFAPRGKKLMQQLLEHEEFVHVSIDAATRAAMRIKGQANYRDSAEKRASTPFDDTVVKRRMLTVRGRTAAVAGMWPIASEAARNIEDLLQMRLPQAALDQCRSLATDDPSGKLYGQLLEICKNLTWLSLDPAHLAISYNSASGMVLNKFNNMDYQATSDAWGPAYSGGQMPPLTPDQKRCRDAVKSGAVPSREAQRLLDNLNGEEHVRSAGDFAKAMFLFNNTRMRHSLPKKYQSSFGSGTSPNEALRAEVNRWFRNQPELYLEALEPQLAAATRAKLIARNAAMYAPALRALTSQTVLATAM
ncbi:unnamed protein product, partial [Prorocentrum cordatum]